MEIIISSKSEKPIYDQIVSQIKKLILTEVLMEGDSLPAMRSLAKSLKVSVITVQKAYEILQRDGFIDSAVGRGSVVAKQDKETLYEENIQIIKQHLSSALAVAEDVGIGKKEVTSLLNRLIDKEE